ncbi:glycosyl transferase family 21-domain-containing protein, partial [Cladochytrium replicatum]
VTILRPLKGVDRNLYENLDSTFRQSYPSFELILSVASPNDPSLGVVERLMKEYPNVDARVIIGDRQVGLNPKVNNLIRGYETAKNDIVWILDSGIWVDENCLRRSVELLLLPNVGLVHQLPCVVKPTTIGAKLEWSFMNGVHARMYTTLNWLNISSCIIGKSMLFRKSVLGLCGGLEPFGKYMSEDNAIGTAIWNQGFKHRQSLDLAYHPTKTPAVEDFCMRMSRWIRTRKYAVPGATAIEPVSESILCGVLSSWGFNVLFGINRMAFFTLHMTLWLLSEIALWSVLDPNDPAHGLGGYLNFPYDAWLLREVIALPMYLYSMAGQTVDWRGTTYRLRANGSLE